MPDAAEALSRRGLTPAEAEQVAHRLGGPVAFLRARQGVFHARRDAGWPFSPVLRLLRGVNATEPGRARFLVRNRVWSTEQASETCRGAIRVGGRSLTAGVPARDHGLSLDDVEAWIDVGPAVAPAPATALAPRGPVAETSALECLAVLASENRDAGTGPRRDRPLAALLVGGDGTLLQSAVNTGARAALTHAEVNLVEAWHAATGDPLPRGARVYTSLKPCALCAGLLWDAAEDPWSIEVVFARDDPGRYARDTVLDPRGMARRRVSRTPREVEAARQRPGAAAVRQGRLR